MNFFRLIRQGLLEVHCRAWMSLDFYRAVLGFVLADILGDRALKVLEVLGSHDNPRVDPGLGKPGQQTGEIEDEFALAVGDQSQVGVDSLGLLLPQLDTDIGGLDRFGDFPSAGDWFRWAVRFFPAPLAV